MKTLACVKFCAVLLCALGVLAFLSRQRDVLDNQRISEGQAIPSISLSPKPISQPSDPKVISEAVDSFYLRDKKWRRTNHIITQYRPDVEARLSSLASRKAPANDPEVIELARDVIDSIPETAAAGIKRSHGIVRTPQAAEVAKIVNGTRGGFFVECGALDGERSSNTIWLEESLGWTGLLVEMDPFFYTQVLGKNRRAFSANACLSPYNYISALPFLGHTAGQGRLIYSAEDGKKDTNKKQISGSKPLVPCFPLQSLMAALNRTRIDYLSLDIEGAEMDVLKTIPWDRLDIRILSVEYLHGPQGKKGYEEFMKSKGYTIYADIHMDSPIFAYDYIFVKKPLH